MAKLRILFVILLFISLISGLSAFQVSTFGDNQSGKVKHFSADEFGVIVKDSLGVPIEGVRVEFSCKIKEAEVQNTRVITDHEGRATNLIKFGKKMGDVKVTAKILHPDEHENVSFTFTVFDYQKLLFYVLGGLGLFLFGIKKLSDSLKLLAGDRLKKFLEIITKNRVFGVCVGVGITALLQSSSATTVMTLGFINAGLLTLKQAISITMGANIGTTVTAQIIAFKIGHYALPAIALGAGMVIFGKKHKTKTWGSLILGFGLLFLGLNVMKDIVKPLRNSVFLSNAFVTLSHNHILAILTGTIMTVIVQSSSATVGLTITLAVSGLIDLNAALGLVLGDNIGTTITAVLASLGSNTNAKRAAAVHVMFNVIGAIYITIVLYMFDDKIVAMMEALSGDIARQIANFHSIFNIFNTLVFLPFVPLLQKLVEAIIPEKEISSTKVTKYLGPNLLTEPALAIEQTKLELGRMMKVSKKAILKSISLFDKGTQLAVSEALALEDETDLYQAEITNYIVKLSQLELSSDQAARIPVLLHIVNDFEKAADYGRNIVEVYQKKFEKSIEFTEEQKTIYKEMRDVLINIFDDLLLALENNDQMKARSVADLEDQLNDLEVKYKKQMIKALSKGSPAPACIMTIDIISNIEKAGDHLYNVAQAVMGILSDDEKTLYSDFLLTNNE